MKPSRLVFVTLMFAAAATAASLLQAVNKSLPMTTAAVDIRCPIGSVCDDGAVWLCWWQKYPDSWFGSSVRSDIGIFCRLFDKNGRDMVRPMRIVAPRGPGDAMTGQNPSPFFACATPDGGFVVFMSDFFPDPRPRDTGFAGVVTSTGEHGKHRTRVVSVSRRGRISSVLLNSSAGGSSWIKVAFGSDGVMHCFTNDLQDHASYARLALRDGRLSILDTVRLDFPVPGMTRLVSWVHDDNIRVAIRILGRDTLLVVHAGKTRDFDHTLWESAPSGLMTSYRLRLPELALIDSASGTDSTLAGVSSVGVFHRRASLVETKRGFLFYLPYPQGMRSFGLDTVGKPVLGARNENSVRSPRTLGATGTQFIEFANRGYGPPWSMEWFGLDSAGNTYCEVQRSDSVPGRIR
ncbi:MAG: hypothetical protein NTX53_20590 [candidate division WOR-3 bacterium]|nr:hypothetical protein [candidate division WOR-3 bacterium]